MMSLRSLLRGLNSNVLLNVVTGVRDPVGGEVPPVSERLVSRPTNRQTCTLH